ncbi:MAG: ATP-dependent Clp protease adapter ClpS [Mariprofundaceae bacterium]|nr:ATP-dependent Clp protease adapter ClpS [Mariprofundaceae bacterium]
MPQIYTADQEELLQEINRHVEAKPPAMYVVLLLNDDYTPIDFVEDVLQRFFKKDADEASKITMQVHQQGQGLCGMFPKDIAESKALQVESFSRQHNHPLQCLAERSES